jgi:hypothetical protein
VVQLFIGDYFRSQISVPTDFPPKSKAFLRHPGFGQKALSMPRRHVGKRKWRSPDYSFSPFIAIQKSVSVIRAAFPSPTGKYSVLKIFCDPVAGSDELGNSPFSLAPGFFH